MKNVSSFVHSFADRAFAERMLSEGFTHVSCVTCGQYVNKKRIVAMVAFHKYEADGSPHERVPTWQIVNKSTEDPQNSVEEVPPCEEWYSLGGLAELLQLHRINMSAQVPLAEVCANWPDALPSEAVEEGLPCVIP